MLDDCGYTVVICKPGDEVAGSLLGTVKLFIIRMKKGYFSYKSS